MLHMLTDLCHHDMTAHWSLDLDASGNYYCNDSTGNKSFMLTVNFIIIILPYYYFIITIT